MESVSRRTSQIHKRINRFRQNRQMIFVATQRILYQGSRVWLAETEEI